MIDVDKQIEEAIDALVLAAFAEGGCSEHRTSEARIQTELRKKELRALLSSAQSGGQAKSAEAMQAVRNGGCGCCSNSCADREDGCRHIHENPSAADMRPAPALEVERVDGDILPPVGSRVYILHGRDNDAHACTVTGYYAWGDLGGNKRLTRLFVRLVYEGTKTKQARMLCDCYPTAEAATASRPNGEAS